MSSPSQESHVAIIGGGFSGILTAVNLVRLSRQPLRITLINHARPAGRGIAYGTRRPEHLLNVAARNMSAFPDWPDHFVRWLRTRSEYDSVPDHELREKFIPRMTYGDYLRGLIHHFLQSDGVGQAPVTFDLIEGEACDLEPTESGLTVRLSDGRGLSVDRVVLATGNEPPMGLPGAEALSDHP
ncbi:MAG: FAD/NAD(P)-binding protein, partial [Verrucomicrobiae bacterium]|nr:FAD/NAD(P)-binding protein [Verrucomicrobiae bacterium]